MKKLDFSKIEYEKVECLFCKEKTKKKLLLRTPDRINNLPGIFSLVRCKKCGLVFQDPRPKEKYIKYYYPDSAGYYQPVEKKQLNIWRWIEKKTLINFYGYSNLGRVNTFIKFILYPIYFYFYKYKSFPHYVKNGKLLEIGCSNGALLKKLKGCGWKVTGIELNKKAAKYGQERANLDIKIGSLFDYEFPKNSFDVVIMDMVLEHLFHPEKAIKKITDFLKPGGQLIFCIPTFDSFESKTFKEYTYICHLPCHLFFFNKSNVKRLLGHSYEKTKIIFHHFDRDIVASANYQYQNNKKYFYKILAFNKLFRALVIKPFVFCLSLLGRTSRMSIRTIKK
ncbi:MAG: class I SAM-dependent methyltransferase [Parcubacteria group bacterium]|nr:class I SAM-dependent methyltransferase [Parcubacteria group bacterium]